MADAVPHYNTIDEYIKSVVDLSRSAGRAYPLIVDKAIDRVDIIDWLAGRDIYPKWYWRGRDGNLEAAAAGSTFEFENVDSGEGSNYIKEILDSIPEASFACFSARNFGLSKKNDSTWHGFPDTITAIPQTMILRRNGEYRKAACHVIGDNCNPDQILREIDRRQKEKIKTATGGSRYALPGLVSFEDRPDCRQWQDNIKSVLNEIDKGRLQKAVMARRTDYRFNENVDILGLARELIKVNPACYCFMFRPEPHLAFISVTPERLFRREGRKLEIDALSSTVTRGKNHEEDLRRERELLENKKLRHEHQLVIDGISERLASLIDGSLQIGPTGVLKLERIQHLATPIEADLLPETGDNKLIAALHPTPAVGGHPREAALKTIDRMEKFNRGWYAAPCGWFDRDRSEYAVGIRSLVVRENRISVFTGAGIVAGSDPDSEWREVESKDILKPLLSEE